MPLMSWGDFVFDWRTTIAPNELSREQGWRHASQSRVGDRPAHQYTGQDEETITLPGQLYPELGADINSLDTLREVADTGAPQVLIDGNGRVWGWYVLEKLTEKRASMLSDGTPLEIDFSLTLKRVDDQP
ncbi:hypothetical protein DFR34_10830 [Rivihabitans pingtungensis]|uniref:Phage protein U n=2 Tax=Rivihabitans pingtungensis TaxID=1054498 RepID=A0A318KNF0_9NEIS|nr:hypothetical protein DFR34_10830 [Rivihabitans pingtungensis]